MNVFTENEAFTENNQKNEKEKILSFPVPYLHCLHSYVDTRNIFHVNAGEKNCF